MSNDAEVERIAELAWRALNLSARIALGWPEGCAYPDHWRAVAFAVLDGLAPRPPVPVTYGPTLMEVVRERDAATKRADLTQSRYNELYRHARKIETDLADLKAGTDKALVTLRAERDDALAEARRTVAECDRAVAEARRERDVARRAWKLALDQRDAAHARAVAAGNERDALRSRLDALETREPTEIELRGLWEVLEGNLGTYRDSHLAGFYYVRDALLASQESGEEGRIGGSPPDASAAAADQRAPAPAPTPTCPHGTREGDSPCPACAVQKNNLAKAESELREIIAVHSGRVIYPDEANALLAELARLRRTIHTAVLHERTAAVEWLRRTHYGEWCAADYADSIENGDHLRSEKENP